MLLVSARSLSGGVLLHAWRFPSTHQGGGCSHCVQAASVWGTSTAGGGSLAHESSGLPPCYLAPGATLCCLTASRLLLPGSATKGVGDDAGCSSETLLLLLLTPTIGAASPNLTLCQALVWGLWPAWLIATALDGVVVGAEPVPSFSCPTSLTCPNTPTFRLTST